MPRIILSLGVIAVVLGAVTFGGTNAFFSDTETATANLFTAGAIDLQIDNESYYNGVFNENTSWDQTDLTLEKFFDFDDVKPNDYGEDTISLHVDTNDAYLCAYVELTSDEDNTQTEPEALVDSDGLESGELDEQIEFIWWADDGDNVLETGEEVISTGTFSELGVGTAYPLTLADSDENIWTGTGGPVDGDTTYYIGKAWCFGDIEAAPIDQDDEIDVMSPAGDNNNNQVDGESEDGGITCDGSLLGNESQTDSLTADVTFEAIQARNNDGFQCDSGPVTTLTLVKELFSDEGVASDWTLTAAGPTDFSGAANSVDVSNVDVVPGTYDLSESGPGGLAHSVWNCVGGEVDDEDTVSITAGDQVTCTIINYIACDPVQQYADSVVTAAQGVRNDLSAIAANRTDTAQVLGVPETNGAPFDSPVTPGTFYSLGFNSDPNVTIGGGTITVEFTDNYLVDGPGNDLRMWEVTGGTSYPVERLMIEVSQDNSSWFMVNSSLDRDAEADLANSGLPWARYVRLTDVSDRTDFNAAADGYDLDAFSALTCADRTYLTEPDET